MKILRPNTNKKPFWLVTQPSINVTSVRFGDCLLLNLLTRSTIVVRKNIYNDRSGKIGLETIQSSPHVYL